MSEQDFIDGFPQFVSQRIAMTPEKFGYIGSYCRSTLSVTSEEDRARWADQMLLKFTMRVMSGRTISEHPEVTFTWFEYASWWDHFKQAVWDWRDMQNRRWEGTGYDGQPDTPPPWMILLWPFLVLFPRWARRHPVNQTPKILKRTVDFTQRILYPQMDHIPPQFGMPVIYETMDFSGPIQGLSNPSRFLDEHEVISQFMRDPENTRYDAYSLGSSAHPVAFLDWLKRNGVNPSQLVKRSR